MRFPCLISNYETDKKASSQFFSKHVDILVVKTIPGSAEKQGKRCIEGICDVQIERKEPKDEPSDLNRLEVLSTGGLSHKSALRN